MARYFQDLGAHIIDADRIGHEAIEPGRAAYREILNHFGAGILDSSGRIDRKKLGPVVVCRSATAVARSMSSLFTRASLRVRKSWRAEYQRQNPSIRGDR